MGKEEAACKESPGNQGPDGHGQAQEYGVFFDGLKIQQGPNAGNYQQDKKAKRPVYENGKDGSSLALGSPLGDVVGLRNISANGANENLVKEDPEKNQGLDFKESVMQTLDLQE
tara:strand:+ start:163 stop:504 length:342 start_codon:yes stop_codon:yes gene_type:complete